MSKRLYLSGPITGVDDYFERFQRAFLALEEAGYNVINPAPLYQVMPDDATYEEYMQICMDLLDMADVIVQMPGWEKSCGCNRELGWAIASDKIIIQLESLFKEGRGE